MDIIINVAVFLISAVIFTFVGMYIRKKLAESKMKSAEAEAKKNTRHSKCRSRK